MSLEIQNLSFSYGERKILSNINFTANPRDLLCVLGPNGVGKSTLFRCLLGFLKNYEGSVKLNNKDIKNLNHSEIAKEISYIPQASIPEFNYTVLEMVLMGTTGSIGLLSSPKEKQIKQAEQALEELEISHLRNRGFNKISGGERQLVLIARTLVQNTKILIMDEPTANLDYGNQYKVMTKVRALAEKGYTILLTTHNPEHAFLFASRVLVLEKGKVLAEGASESTLDENLIQKAYGVNVIIHEDIYNGTKLRSCVPVGKAEF